MNSLPATPHKAHSGRTAGSAIYAVAILGLFVAIAGLGAAYGLRSWFEAQAHNHATPELTTSHIITIGAQRYVMPAALLSESSQRRDGFSDRMDFTIALPLGTGDTLSEVAITIMPRGRMRTSAALLDSVYLHQFSGTQLSGVQGLVGKPLDSDAGTAGETVWYDPLNANPFVAKCMTPIAMTIGDKTCMRVLSLADRNTAIVTFNPVVLDNWRRFDTHIEAALAPLRK
ncbi:hypothetical protein [Pelagibacterium sp.]|uniref:hypothetical protein n=1 Tax=Pelagibacterium sp. TaxID=1967288 RepID=UPI003A8D2F95